MDAAITVEIIVNFVGAGIMVPFDIFLVYHLLIRHKLIFNIYFITMTIYSINGTLYMFFSAVLDVQAIYFMRRSYEFYQYFIPLLSVVMSFNRFTAIVIWPWHQKIWKYKFFIIYGIAISAFSFFFMLVNHADLLQIRADPAYTLYFRLFDRVFKGSAYIVSLIFEMTAVIYRKVSKKTLEIDKVDITLLTQSVITTTCWLINCICNLIWFLYSVIGVIHVSNCFVVFGFVLPLAYLFSSNRKLRMLLLHFYFRGEYFKNNAVGTMVHISVQSTKTPVRIASIQIT
uniref:Serpentine receptor class gamma n=1 Tax=Panagrellus redivivus TaxID=6233 RepID=A0A7E4V365_PANRE